VPGADPGRLGAVAQGRAVVQDEASMLVARAVLDGRADSRTGAADPAVIDACAGPGGKTTHLAQLGARGRRDGAATGPGAHGRQAAGRWRRAPVAIGVAVVVADATAPPLRPGAFDAALVDAPCTGLGVMRRRPELRWRRDLGDPSASPSSS
jgi:16S rRNA (cytosine967-C5)-methyltransferase